MLYPKSKILGLDVAYILVQTDQPGRCQFFRKYEIVKNLKKATIKLVIIHLSNLLKLYFRKSHYVTFLFKTLNVPYWNTHLQFDHCWLSRVLDTQNHTFSIGFEWKCWFVNLWLLTVLRFILRILSINEGFASHQRKLNFYSMYGGLDTPCSSNNMKTAKEGSLDVWNA